MSATRCRTCLNKKSARFVRKDEFHVVIYEDGKKLVWHLRCFLMYRANFNKLWR